MKYLDTILANSVAEKQDRDKIRQALEKTAEKMKAMNIVFADENAEMVFENHLAALAKRVIDHELIPDLDASLMEGVSQQAMDIARELISDLFAQFDCELTQSELFLVATHIQLYLETGKGGNSNE